MQTDDSVSDVDNLKKNRGEENRRNNIYRTTKEDQVQVGHPTTGKDDQMVSNSRKTRSDSGDQDPTTVQTVSYTHLDVYKRQGLDSVK